MLWEACEGRLTHVKTCMQEECQPQRRSMPQSLAGCASTNCCSNETAGRQADLDELARLVSRVQDL